MWPAPPANSQHSPISSFPGPMTTVGKLMFASITSHPHAQETSRESIVFQGRPYVGEVKDGRIDAPPVASVLKSGLVRFFASKWGNRNRNRLHTYPDIDEPQPDCLEPVQYSSWIEKNQFKPVFCRNFYCANITYRFLNKYYPDHLIVI